MIILYIFLGIVILSIFFASISLAPWVPTHSKDMKRICELARIKEGEVFYDLGCGDGRLVFYSAKNYGTNSIGIELALPFYLYCQVRKYFSGDKKTIFKLKSLYLENLSSADIIFFFAASSKKIDKKLQDKLKSELKPGARIVSYVFSIEGWKPEQISKPTKNDLPIYLYKM